MKVLNFEKYQLAEDLSNFIANPTINESDNKDSQINGILKKLSQDLKFNYGLVFTFGVGVRVMYPIVEGLISNGSLKVEPTMENIVLVSIAALTITYLEESKNKAGDSEVPCNCKNKSKDCEKNEYANIKSDLNYMVVGFRLIKLINKKVNKIHIYSGGWFSKASYCQLNHCINYPSTFHYMNLGFRLINKNN